MKKRFRELVKRLHPDLSGDRRTVTAFRRIVELHRKQNTRYNHCWCGVTIKRTARRCAMHSRSNTQGLLAA